MQQQGKIYTYPGYSPAIDQVPDDGALREIADKARGAFFKVVCDEIDSLYPGSRTSGDEMPGEAAERDEIALRWVKEHATNNYNPTPPGKGERVQTPDGAVGAVVATPDGVGFIGVRLDQPFGVVRWFRASDLVRLRTILVHVNVEVPESIDSPHFDSGQPTADDVAAEITAAINVAAEGGEDYVPVLNRSTFTIPLAEEV